MTRRQPFYDDDLAYIQDVGFSGFATGSAPGLLQILRTAGIHNGLVADVGCGSGVWAKHLVDAGYRVSGVDVSPAIVAVARQRVKRAEFQVGSLWSHRFTRCRAVTALGEVICYMPDNRVSNRKLDTFFRRVFEALESGGLLIFDVAEVGLDRDRKPTFFEGDDWACLISFSYDEKRDRLVRQITSFRKLGKLYRRSHEQHVVQLHRRSEVADALRKIGFRVRSMRRYGSYRLLPGRLGFIARKP